MTDLDEIKRALAAEVPPYTHILLHDGKKWLSELVEEVERLRKGNEELKQEVNDALQVLNDEEREQEALEDLVTEVAALIGKAPGLPIEVLTEHEQCEWTLCINAILILFGAQEDPRIRELLKEAL